MALVYEVLHDPVGAVFCAGVFSLCKSHIFFALQVMLRRKERLREGRLTFH